MSKCWTCGSHVSGYAYTCSSCESLEELKSLQKKVSSCGKDISNHLDYIAQVQQEGFSVLNATLSVGLSEIASAMKWGFDEVIWQLQQQTDVLKSIDHTLKTPSETQANEWRLQAEELRSRGILEESEEFFSKALNEYRLDYRIYIGLSKTYLQMSKFDKAKALLEKSLPHAPKKEIDYKSYSYRLIGHIYACEEDYNHAVSVLRDSIELSPTYEDGHYDYAQYSAQIGNTEDCLSSLEKVILIKPMYFYLSQKEKNFDSLRNEVTNFLSNLSTQALRRTKDAIAKSENMLKQGREAAYKARQALGSLRENRTNATTVCIDSEMKLKLSKDKVESGDYVEFLAAKLIAEESFTLANNSVKMAEEEIKLYQYRRRMKAKRVWKRVPGAFLGWPLLFGIIGGIGGCSVEWFSGPLTSLSLNGYFYSGMTFGFIFGICKILNQLQIEQ